MKQKPGVPLEEEQNVFPSFFKIYLPLALLIFAAFGIYFYVDTQHEEKLIHAELSRQVELSKQTLLQDITGVVQELKYLAASDSLNRFITTGDARIRSEAEKEVAKFARYIGYYDQIRWLDLTGQERLRVDHRDGVTHIVPVDRLQDKSKRYYFSESITLSSGEIYISPLDLNVEHEAVEVPYRPMLRFATPTENEEGTRNGLLIVNYQAASMLEKFTRTKQQGPGTLSLLNQEGYWLVGPEPEREWGFMFDRDERFENAYPEVWRAIQQQKSGSFSNGGGLFTYTTIDALTDVTAEPGTPGGNGRWIVVSHYPQGPFNALYGEHLWLYGTLLFLALLAVGILSWKTASVTHERNRTMEQLTLHAKVMEAATNGVIITDERPRVVAVNQAFTDLTGYSREDIFGKDPSILASGRHGENFYAAMWAELEEKGHWEGEIWNRHKNGELFPEWLSITEVPGLRGQSKHYIAIFSMLSEQKSTEERLRELASSDPLTGLINRNLLHDRARQALAHSHRTETHTAFLFLDLDGFKPINDALGHNAGDKVLKEVARRIKTCVRESDTVARFGGDEFMVLLPELRAAEEAAAIAEKIRLSIFKSILYGKEVCHVGVSIGISLYPDDGESVDELIQHADQAMYCAKEEGKGRVEFYHRSKS